MVYAQVCTWCDIPGSTCFCASTLWRQSESGQVRMTWRGFVYLKKQSSESFKIISQWKSLLYSICIYKCTYVSAWTYVITNHSLGVVVGVNTQT